MVNEREELKRDGRLELPGAHPLIRLEQAHLNRRGSHLSITGETYGKVVQPPKKAAV